MTNLTASEARRLIDKLHHNQTKEHGISILEEKYLQALEIALPALEQQESTTDTYRQIENDDWIEWGGTDGCPVEAEATVIVRLTNPRDTLQAKAGEFEWSSDKANDPITAYRVIENDGREG